MTDAPQDINVEGDVNAWLANIGGTITIHGNLTLNQWREQQPDQLRAQTTVPIFISYSRANTAFAQDLYVKLRALGFTLWRDRTHMAAGESWWTQIQTAIRGSQTMVLCLSPEALASPIVADEWRYARREGTRVIPVLAADVDFKAAPRWMAKRDWLDFRVGAPEQDIIWSKFIGQLNTPHEPRPIPFNVPSLPERFVPRSDVFEPLLAQLLDADHQNPVAITTALQGGGGFGKTTLALALCHDTRVRDAFDDGLLWIEFGESPDVLRLLNTQIKVLGRVGTEIDSNTAATTLRDLLEDKDILLVLDDIWNELHARPFLQRSSKTRAAHLITTRSQTVLERLNALSAVVVDEMTSEQSVTLLTGGLTIADVDRPAFRELAGLLGEWALLLEIVGAELRQRVLIDGESHRVALAAVETRLKRRGFTHFDRMDEGERNKAVSLSLEVSLERLKERRQRFIELAIFPEDTDIPFQTVEQLWTSSADYDDIDSEDALKAMARLSLFQRYDAVNQSLRLHDVMRQVLLPMLETPSQTHQALIDAWGDLTGLTDEYAWRNIAYHLREAGRIETLRGLLLDFKFLQAKLNATDANALLADFGDLTAEESLRLVESALSMSAHVISQDKTQFANQLYGRLLGHHREPDISGFLSGITFLPHMLIPLSTAYPPLQTAGGSLKRVLTGHTGYVNRALELSNGRLLSWSDDTTLRLWQADGTFLSTLTGHTKEVYGALAMADGRLLSWSNDHTLRLWQADGTLQATLIGHTDSVDGGLVLSDSRLLSWSDDSTLRLWQTDTTPLATLTGHTGYVAGALELLDGILLSWSGDQTLRLWQADGTPLALLTGHTEDVRGALQLSDGRLLSWSDDTTLRLWQADGTPLALLTGHTDSVRGALALSDGRLLSWSADHTLRLWQADGTPQATLTGHTGYVDGALEPSDGRVLSWSYDSTLRLWQADGAPQATLTGHTDDVTGALVLLDGRLLSWSYDHTLRLWQADGAPQATLTGHTDSALALSDGRLLSWSADHTLRLWQADGTILITVIGHRLSVTGALQLSDGRLLSWSAESTQLWEADGTPLKTLNDHSSPHPSSVTGALQLSDSRLLSWSAESIRLWQADGTPLATLTGHTDSVTGSLQLSDGRLLSWSDDHTLRLWQADGTPLATLIGHTDSVYGALALSDGRLLSWSADHTLRLWQADGTPLATLIGHTNTVYRALVLSDGRLLSWSADHTLRLWQADGTPLATLIGHTDTLYGVLALSDGRLLSWSYDSTLHLWQADGTSQVTLIGHTGYVAGALALSDGRLLSWSADHTLRLWQVDGTPLATLTGHSGNVSGALQLTDGRLLSWSANGTLCLWSGTTHQHMTCFYGDAPISCCVVLDNGTIVVGDGQGRVIFLRENR